MFVADHGEEFLDHGLWLHGRSLFDELIRVPLVVKFPRNAWAGRRVAEQVQGLDIVPTVLEALGVPLATDLGGVPLQRVIRGETKPRPALAEISHRGFVAHGVRTEQGQVHPPLQPGRRRALLRPRARPGRAGQPGGAAAAACAPARGAGRGGHGPEPVPLRPAARRRRALRAPARDARLARGRRGDGLRDRGALDARRQRALARARGPAARRRAARAGVHRAADRRPGPAQRHARRPRRCARATS